MRLTILLSATFLIISSLHAQEPCKARMKSNRNLSVTVSEPKLVSRSWNYQQKEQEVIAYSFNGYDSINVRYNDSTASLIARDGVIKTGRYTEYDLDGKLQKVDSFGAKINRPYFYLGAYSAAVSSVHEFYPNGSLRSLLYYDTIGGIRLIKAWYTNGQMSRYEDQQRQETWFNDGKRASITDKTTHEERRYHDTGALEHRSIDTIIDNVPLNYKRWYFKNGDLKREQSALHTGEAYGTWTTYDANGKITEQHHFPTVYDPNKTYTREAMQSIDMNHPATFRKKGQDFPTYLKIALEPVICEARAILSGSYTIRFEIDHNGTPRFLSVTGSNATALEAGLKTLFDNSLQWENGEVNGSRTFEVFEVKVNMVKRTKE